MLSSLQVACLDLVYAFLRYWHFHNILSSQALLNYNIKRIIVNGLTFVKERWRIQNPIAQPKFCQNPISEPIFCPILFPLVTFGRNTSAYSWTNMMNNSWWMQRCINLFKQWLMTRKFKLRPELLEWRFIFLDILLKKSLEEGICTSMENNVSLSFRRYPLYIWHLTLKKDVGTESSVEFSPQWYITPI